MFKRVRRWLRGIFCRKAKPAPPYSDPEYHKYTGHP